jgi:hypothetical protein
VTKPFIETYSALSDNFVEDVTFSDPLFDLFVKIYPGKQRLRDHEPEIIVLVSQREVNFLQRAIFYRYQIHTILEKIENQKFKNRLERLYSVAELIHPIECVNLDLLVFRLGKLIEVFKDINGKIQKVFIKISCIRSETDSLEIETIETQIGKLLEWNQKIIEEMEKLYRKFCTKNN